MSNKAPRCAQIAHIPRPIHPLGLSGSSEFTEFANCPDYNGSTISVKIDPKCLSTANSSTCIDIRFLGHQGRGNLSPWLRSESPGLATNMWGDLRPVSQEGIKSGQPFSRRCREALQLRLDSKSSWASRSGETCHASVCVFWGPFDRGDLRGAGLRIRGHPAVRPEFSG